MLGDQRWNQCLERLEAELPERDMSTWIRPLRAVAGDDHVTLFAPNRVVLEHVRNEYLSRIRKLVSDAAGYDVGFTLAIGASESSAPSVVVSSGTTASVPASTSDAPLGHTSGRLDPRYTLDLFIEGKSNSQARAAGMQVASKPGQIYNPLLIYGESGLGKTHLMHGIGNAVLAANTGARIVYVGAEQWFNQMVSSIRYNRTAEFRDFYRSADVLLIDDIHFLAGKERSQEEFFYTFNALTDHRKQIVLTCDKYPRELDDLDERLKSRFTWGLSVPVDPPELETRMAILLSKADSMGIRLPEEVANLVAQKLRKNVRELEGALHRLSASARLTGAPITLDFARSTLRDMLASYDRAVTLDNIKRSVANYYNIRLSDLSSARRTRSLARPRQLAMALAKDLTQHSYPEIGSAFDKDHTTVMHACRKVAELRASDDRIREDFDNLQRLLTN